MIHIYIHRVRANPNSLYIYLEASLHFVSPGLGTNYILFFFSMVCVIHHICGPKTNETLMKKDCLMKSLSERDSQNALRY